MLWTDVSISYAGYCSDFGRTWLVGEQAVSAPASAIPISGANPRRGADGDQSRCDVG